MEQREGRTGRGGRGSSRRASLAPAKSVLPCPGAGVADGHGAPSPARSRLVMLPKVETEALGLARSNGEQGQMPENMQGKGGDSRRSPSAHARVSLGKVSLRPAKKVCGSCLRAAPSLPAPRPAEPLPSRARFQGGSSGYRGPRCPGRGEDKALLRRCKRGRGAVKHLAGGSLPGVQMSRRTLPGPAGDPEDLGLIPVPRKTASKFMTGRVTRGSSGEHPVCHTPSRNGPRRLCPAGAAPTGTVQVAVAVSRNFAGESSDSVADLRPCGVPRKADGCLNWDGSGNVCVGWRDRAVPGARLGAGAVAEGGGADPAEGRLPALEPAARYVRPTPLDSPGTETPVPVAL